ncbi:MAG: tetratricopeptide repeat protein [Candidatus Methanoperedens sp.]|nr:tetratricopeptide repeat protein [Candidatus Methanoperedens sp.]
MELNQEQLSKLDELVTLITLSKDGAIAFVLCNEPVLRTELYNELEKRLEILNTKIINIQLDENSSDLVNEIREKVSSTKNKATIFVYGIEKSSKAVTSSGKSAFLTKLNIMREEFSNINQPVIIWSNEATLSKIAIEAPDFWSWRTTVFEFRMEKATQPFEKTERIVESELENLTVDELNERYKQYSELLEEYKNKNIVDDYKFADWYLKLGMIHYLRGEYDEALEKYKQSLEIDEKLGDQQGIAANLNNIAVILANKCEYDEALETYKQLMEIIEKFGDHEGLALALNNIALIHQTKGEYNEALEKYNQSMEIDKKLGDQRGIAQTLHNIAVIHQKKGEYDEALEKYRQSMEINKKLGNQRGIAQTLHNIATIHKIKGEYDEALEEYKQSMEIDKKLGDQRGIAQTLHMIAMIHQDKGEYNEAFEKYNQSTEVYKKIGDLHGLAYTFAQMGLLYSQMGKKEEAIESTQKALEIFEKIGLENEARKAKDQIKKMHL